MVYFNLTDIDNNDDTIIQFSILHIFNFSILICGFEILLCVI